MPISQNDPYVENIPSRDNPIQEIAEEFDESIGSWFGRILETHRHEPRSSPSVPSSSPPPWNLSSSPRAVITSPPTSPPDAFVRTFDNTKEVSRIYAYYFRCIYAHFYVVQAPSLSDEFDKLLPVSQPVENNDAQIMEVSGDINSL